MDICVSVDQAREIIQARKRLEKGSDLRLGENCYYYLALTRVKSVDKSGGRIRLSPCFAIRYPSVRDDPEGALKEYAADLAKLPDSSLGF